MALSKIGLSVMKYTRLTRPCMLEVSIEAGEIVLMCVAYYTMRAIQTVELPAV